MCSSLCFYITVAGALADIEQPNAISEWKQDSETAQAIQRLFIREYVERWRKFVTGFR